MIFGTTPLVWGLETLAITALLVLGAWLVERPLEHYPAVRRLVWGLVLCRFLVPPLMSWPEITALLPTPAKVPESVPRPQPNDLAAPPIMVVDVLSVVPLDDPIPPQLAIEPPEFDARPVEVSAALPKPESVAERPFTHSLHAVLHWTGWPGLLLTVWTAGSILNVVWLTSRLMLLRRRLRSARSAPQRLISLSRDVAVELGLRPLRVEVVDGIETPFVCCLGRTRLIWPAAFITGIATNRLRGIMAHELAHVRQFDHWWQWVDLVARVVWWWNPLCGFARRKLWEASEQVCDAVALTLGGIDRREYAEMFLELSTGPMSAMPLPVLGWRGSNQAFQRRLTMMLSENVSRRAPWKVVALVLLAGLATLPAWTTAGEDVLFGDEFIVGDITFGSVATTAAVGEAPAPASEPAAPLTSTPIGVPSPATVTFGTTFETLILNQVEPTGIATESTIRKTMTRTARPQPTRQQSILRLTAMYYTALADERTADALALQEALTALGASIPATATTTNPMPSRTIYSRSWGPQPSIVEPTNLLRSFRGYGSLAVRLKVTGAVEGLVWGSGPYTDDSAIAAAAVHAGVMKVGESADVVVKFSGPGESFAGSTRNGVTSSDFSHWGGSYSVAPLAEMPDAPYLTSRSALVDNFSAYLTVSMLAGQAPIQPGTSLIVSLEGKLTGAVWGDGIYTSDSSLDAAAVHSGVLKGGESGFVKVTLLPGQDTYGGGAKNGVESSTYGTYRMSYRLDRLEQTLEPDRGAILDGVRIRRLN